VLSRIGLHMPVLLPGEGFLLHSTRLR
jgi:hypothetical protein